MRVRVGGVGVWVEYLNLINIIVVFISFCTEILWFCWAFDFEQRRVVTGNL